MSKLSKTEKINEHHFNIETAKKYGVNKAILLYNLSYWLDHNKANKANVYKYKGKKYYWTYNSARAFEELFPYFNKRSITRWLGELEEDGVIVSGEFNKTKYDRTKWYTMLSYSTTQNGKWVGQSGSPIPDSKPDSKHKSKSTYSAKGSKKPSKKLLKIRLIVRKFAELSNGGELDDSEFGKLKSSYSRHAGDAKKLLKLCGDDENKALQAIVRINRWAREKELTWNIGTVIKNFYQINELGSTPKQSSQQKRVTRDEAYRLEMSKYPTMDQIKENSEKVK